MKLWSALFISIAIDRRHFRKRDKSSITHIHTPASLYAHTAKMKMNGTLKTKEGGQSRASNVLCCLRKKLGQSQTLVYVTKLLLIRLWKVRRSCNCHFYDRTSFVFSQDSYVPDGRGWTKVLRTKLVGR